MAMDSVGMPVSSIPSARDRSTRRSTNAYIDPPIGTMSVDFLAMTMILSGTRHHAVGLHGSTSTQEFRQPPGSIPTRSTAIENGPCGSVSACAHRYCDFEGFLDGNPASPVGSVGIWKTVRSLIVSPSWKRRSSSCRTKPVWRVHRSLVQA